MDFKLKEIMLGENKYFTRDIATPQSLLRSLKRQGLNPANYKFFEYRLQESMPIDRDIIEIKRVR